MSNTAAKVYIGKSQEYNAPAGDYSDVVYADGAIDEVSIWDAELTHGEIIELYNGGVYRDINGKKNVAIRSGPGDLQRHSQYDKLISWWRLGDVEDTVSSGVISTSVDRKSSNNATGQGSPLVTPGPPPGLGEMIVTVSSYDNAFVSHMIPRTDKQYSWITSSLNS